MVDGPVGIRPQPVPLQWCPDQEGGEAVKVQGREACLGPPLAERLGPRVSAVRNKVDKTKVNKSQQKSIRRRRRRVLTGGSRKVELRLGIGARTRDRDRVERSCVGIELWDLGRRQRERKKLGVK
jgi:hypothetical protein